MKREVYWRNAIPIKGKEPFMIRCEDKLNITPQQLDNLVDANVRKAVLEAWNNDFLMFLSGKGKLLLSIGGESITGSGFLKDKRLKFIDMVDEYAQEYSDPSVTDAWIKTFKKAIALLEKSKAEAEEDKK
jgi:hypothetical protein